MILHVTSTGSPKYHLLQSTPALSPLFLWLPFPKLQKSPSSNSYASQKPTASFLSGTLGDFSFHSFIEEMKHYNIPVVLISSLIKSEGTVNGRRNLLILQWTISRFQKMGCVFFCQYDSVDQKNNLSTRGYKIASIDKYCLQRNNSLSVLYSSNNGTSLLCRVSDSNGNERKNRIGA